MARMIAMLDEARSAGLQVRREGAGLIVRGQAGLADQARELLDLKPLVLAVLDHEQDCRDHERSEHLGQAVDWRLAADGGLVCSACRPAAGDEDGAAASAGQATGQPACSMCGSAGSCEGRLTTADGGWVCLAAVADGVVRSGGPGSVQERPEQTETTERRSGQSANGGSR
jgi:hypothetical protein